MTDEKGRILIAEDEKPMANALKTKLESEGYAITTADDGEEALELLSDQEFDLLILDLIMPRKDGWHVLEALKEKGSTIPIMVATNLSQTEDKQRAKELGAQDFIVKSETPIADIVERIRGLI